MASNSFHKKFVKENTSKLKEYVDMKKTASKGNIASNPLNKESSGDNRYHIPEKHSKSQADTSTQTQYTPSPAPSTRSSALTKLMKAELMTKMLELISEGMPIVNACAIVGINRSTYYATYHKSEELQRLVDEARSIFIKKHLANIENVAVESKQWTASAWLLERSFPEHYSSKSEIRYRAEKNKGKPNWFGQPFEDAELQEFEEVDNETTSKVDEE